MYLPPCSPDLSPVESCGSKIKELIRVQASRAASAIYDAMGAALPHRARQLRFNAPVRNARALAFCGALLALGCVVPKPSPKLPDVPYIAVLSGQMPPPIDEVARHSWIAVRGPKGEFYRFEYGGHRSYADPFADFAAGDVMVHGVYEGTVREVEAKAECLDAAERDYYHQYRDYFPIPGPNSNTFVAFLLRRCRLGIELPATAIGRDYVGVIGADLTEARTGIQLGLSSAAFFEGTSCTWFEGRLAS
jgi:hypothetical protein